MLRDHEATFTQSAVWYGGVSSLREETHRLLHSGKWLEWLTTALEEPGWKTFPQTKYPGEAA